ncbi:uncharacterized protein LOC122525966 isoform X2 [Polistes fuscatus]|uniref:uncharacterized protein LOC122525966 isoform X2 n=1 Tax=Polistes fuscatus TaxID=30207 RepID=UPI001CA7D659|nr:uncharacterized protein LOC122525966 isoform X2 [Polistes fuscatus]
MDSIDPSNSHSNVGTKQRMIFSKHVELSAFTKPAPFALRPYAGLFNPYSYGCSVLCNHPVDNEAKEVVRRAKDTWASEGKALLLPEEMEMIRARLLAAGRGGIVMNSANLDTKEINIDTLTVPEELFRKYTETDSRPPTPAPTLVSVQAAAVSCRPLQNAPPPIIYNPRERTTLVLDLRTNSQPHLSNDTLTWHALTLEVLPISRRNQIVSNKPLSSRRRFTASTTRLLQPPYALSSSLNAKTCETIVDNNVNDNSDEPTVVRRRGKKLRKRKCRRDSIYGQQTEVRDPFEPLETQISQTNDESRRASIHPLTGGSCTVISSEKVLVSLTEQTMHFSFIPAEILKHLCRELNRDKIEAEFSMKRKIAFEEALRVKGETHFALSGTRQTSVPPMQNVPRVFSRQTARFEILDSQSLYGITALDYLSRHVFVSSGRKLIYSRAFVKFHEENLQGNRYISSNDIQEALEDAIGMVLSNEQKARFNSFLGNILEPLNFRTWCGVCAATERLLCPLPSKQIDPPMWLERLDFEMLERRIDSIKVDSQLALLLREIRKR